jgi:hypothetical protein
MRALLAAVARRPAPAIAVLLGLALCAALALALLERGGGHGTGKLMLPPAGVVTLVNRTWVCNGPVDIGVVRVTMDATVPFDRSAKDAIHLEDGCTGRIGRVEVTQYVGDGIKVAQGAHDLTIGGGSIRCLAKAPKVHQDGIQVMGGARITFDGLDVDCGRPGARLINSNLFIRQAGRSTVPPTDVVCVGCTFGGYAAHTVSIQNSIRSGITGSSLCQAKYPRLTLSIGAGAVDPVDRDDTIQSCGGTVP